MERAAPGTRQRSFRTGLRSFERIVSVVSSPMVPGNVIEMRSFAFGLSFALRSSDFSDSLAAFRLTVMRLALNGQPRPLQRRWIVEPARAADEQRVDQRVTLECVAGVADR